MAETTDKQDIIELTPAAVDKIAGLIASRKKGPLAVRVVLRGRLPGGGFQSEFKFVDPDDKAGDDLVQDAGPFTLLLDPDTADSIRGALVDFDEKRYTSGFHIVYPDQIGAYPEAVRREFDDPVAQAAQKAINEQVNPAVAGHGGWVALLEVKDETAYIEMGGGCQGCGLSFMTLKEGIERIIFDTVPQIKEVLDVTEHAEGKNPYYSGEWGDAESPLSG
jgi:Fe/S biogenesis protein NfuA